jgi:hypothetical protein
MPCDDRTQSRQLFKGDGDTERVRNPGACHPLQNRANFFGQIGKSRWQWESMNTSILRRSKGLRINPQCSLGEQPRVEWVVDACVGIEAVAQRSRPVLVDSIGPQSLSVDGGRRPLIEVVSRWLRRAKSSTRPLKHDHPGRIDPQGAAPPPKDLHRAAEEIAEWALW